MLCDACQKKIFTTDSLGVRRLEIAFLELVGPGIVILTLTAKYCIIQTGDWTSI